MSVALLVVDVKKDVLWPGSAIKHKTSPVRQAKLGGKSKKTLTRMVFRYSLESD